MPRTPGRKGDGWKDKPLPEAARAWPSNFPCVFGDSPGQRSRFAGGKTAGESLPYILREEGEGWWRRFTACHQLTETRL